jgi:peptidoglycan pentaglycine glycine transferase (the first glycine)
MDATTWNSRIASSPEPHLLQTFEWGQVKSAYGWQSFYKSWQNNLGKPIGSALILQRAIPIVGFAAKLRVMYVPKGPILEWSDISLRQCVLKELSEFARKQGAIFIKIDPNVFIGTGIRGEPDAKDNQIGQEVIAELSNYGWHFSNEQIQFCNTILVDLTPSEEELQARMKQKTRYNINLALRKGVTVRLGDHADIRLLYRMYAETSVRDNFIIREEQYYRHVWETYFKKSSLHTMDEDYTIPVAEPLIAEVDGEPVAALVLFRFAHKAWYLYGMSRDIHREKMPNHLLQWEAMRRAKQTGCTVYDLWGAPDRFDETDPMWSVYRFKKGLGGYVVRTIGAWDLPVRPLYYRLYTQTLPRILAFMRRQGKEQAKRLIST